MVNIIICDDNDFFRETIKTEIAKMTKINNIKISIYEFDDFDEKWNRFIFQEASKLENKIYLLDIETPSGNGVSIGRKIRQTDLKSFLIYITAYSGTYSISVLRSNSRFSSYISKDEDYIAQLNQILTEILLQGFDDMIINFTDQGITYNIEINDIVFIKTIPEKRKTLIITTYAKFLVNKNLKFFEEILDQRFHKVHKCSIVNIKHIEYIDRITRIIKFDNGEVTNLVSANYLKSTKNQQ